MSPGGGGVEGGAPLREHLGVARQQDPGQQPHQRHVADDQEHLDNVRTIRSIESPAFITFLFWYIISWCTPQFSFSFSVVWQNIHGRE